ncbi:MAG: manganese catalase family protein, partial [Bacteroidaceae bacterium]|nr:manganese catalase family protein [Bacteroidaceae bacterium]
DIEKPLQTVVETNGLTDIEPKGTHRTEEEVRSTDKKLSKERSKQIKNANADKDMYWCDYDTHKTKTADVSAN